MTTELIEASVIAKPPLMPANRNIIAVASGNAGVGKTWFAITLAHALAYAGRKVLLFDGDLNLANVRLHLGLRARGDIAAVISGETKLADLVIPYDGGAGCNGFDIIAGRSDSEALANPTEAMVVKLRNDLHTLSRDYDWVVMDLGAGIDRSARLLAATARTCLVTTTAEMAAVTETYAYIKMTARENFPEAVRIVINKAPTIKQGQIVYDALFRACRKFLKVEPPLAGIVRRDNLVMESLLLKDALLSYDQNSNAAREIEQIARRLDKDLRVR